jgi:hypothetical protein
LYGLAEVYYFASENASIAGNASLDSSSYTFLPRRKRRKGKPSVKRHLDALLERACQTREEKGKESFVVRGL